MKTNYKKIFILILLNIIVISEAESEIAGYRIFFRDKGPEAFEPGTQIYNNTLDIHSEKSIQRRLRINNQNPFSIEDAPVYKPYADALKIIGASVWHEIRWYNYVVAYCDSITAQKISGQSFVLKVQKTSSKFTTDKYSEIPDGGTDNEYIYYPDTHSGCGEFYYGESSNQLAMLNIIKLHQMGITGNGVVIGLIDTGFDTELSTFSHVNFLGKYDFVYNDTIVKDDTKDIKVQDPHGTMVLSAIAAFTHDNLIGAAPFCSFLLAKTEDLNSERLIEEDNFAAAVEWLESRGTDIISVSLSYNKFDSTDTSHLPGEFDGKTTLASRYLNEATKRGVVCVASAGNKGPSPNTIYTPGDSDSAITVGAVLSDGITPAPFTSHGFMADGDIKPDISAQGKDVITIHPEKKQFFFRAEGTSFSAPLIAGSVALMLSVHPDMKPWQVKKALISDATLKNSPDSALGYGVPDVFESIRTFGTIISPPAVYPSNSKIKILTNIYSDPESEILLHFRANENDMFSQTIFKYVAPNKYLASIPIPLKNDTSEFYITVSNPKGTKRYPGRENEYLKAASNTTEIPCGIGENFLYDYLPDFTAGIYPNLIDNGNEQLHIYFNLILGSNVTISVYSTNGNELFNENYGLYPQGLNHIPIKLTSLSSGMYYIKIDNITEFQYLKFIILN
jgi:serine protease AprX